MIPFKDDNPTQTTPLVTIGLIVLNCAVFIWQVLSPLGGMRIAFMYGAIPHNIISFDITQPIHPVTSIFTAMFLHGGFLHLSGNMLYVWIFGNNIEDALGHVKFVFFYLFSGLVAAYSHAFIDPQSTIPMIGASGAVSGILGAYLLLFPRAKVYTLLILGIFIQVVLVPAIVVIGFWAVLQFLNGLLSTGLHQQGGVAWFAHIGGFLAGIVTIRLWLPRQPYA